MALLARRLVQLVGVLLVVTFFSYLLLNLLPGNVAVAVLGPNATATGIAHVTAELHLNQPLPQRYIEWLWQVLQGTSASRTTRMKPSPRRWRSACP